MTGKKGKARKRPKQLTEADFEARIAQVLRSVFPWVGDSLRHQTTFSLRLGHHQVRIDAAKSFRVRGRADILILDGDTPLAVLELKRNDLALSTEDHEQGLSYARLLDPMPPLVAITNGKDTVFLETHSGKNWTPATKSQAAVASLIAEAASVAAADLNHAVGVLLGPKNEIWVSAVRSATASAISELTGDWDGTLPFVDGFLVPRVATDVVLSHLRDGNRLLMVEGQPMSGKSSVLRDLSKRTSSDSPFVVLYLAIEGSVGTGIFQTLADLLSARLNWHVTAGDAREWVRRLSHTAAAAPAVGPILVLAIDGIGFNHTGVRLEVEQLASAVFGKRVRVVLALDESVADALTQRGLRVGKTKLGRDASEVKLGPLNDSEFIVSQTVLHSFLLQLEPGAWSEDGYRVPWLIRAIVGGAVSRDEYNGHNVGVLPPVLGLDVIRLARSQFDANVGLISAYQDISKALLADLESGSRSVDFQIQRLSSFLIRRSTMLSVVREADLAEYVLKGLVKLTLIDNEPTFVVRIPELLASELARAIAKELESSAPGERAAILLALCKDLPLGDVIGAQAVVDYGMSKHGFPVEIITSLLELPPYRESIKTGAHMAMALPDGGRMDVIVQDDLSLKGKFRGEEFVLPPDPNSSETFGRLEPWLILSHLAGIPMEFASAEDRLPVEAALQNRADVQLLLEVGTCPLVLRRPNIIADRGPLAVHNIDDATIVCYAAGVVEPITMSLQRFLSVEWSNSDGFIKEIIDSDSLPLIARADIALRGLAEVSHQAKAAWAAATISRLQPLMGNLIHDRVLGQLT